MRLFKSRRVGILSMAFFLLMAITLEPGEGGEKVGDTKVRGPITSLPTAPTVLDIDLRRLPVVNASEETEPAQVRKDLEEPADPSAERPEATLRQSVSPKVLDIDLRQLPTVEPWKPGDPIREMPDLREYPDSQETAAAPTKENPWIPVMVFEGITTVEAEASLIGPRGAVGLEHYVQVMDRLFAVYDKEGSLLVGPTPIHRLWRGAGEPCGRGRQADSIVQYDPLADRWLLSEFQVLGNRRGFDGCIAVSRSGNLLEDGWYLYHFQLPVALKDPMLAVWPDGYYAAAADQSGVTVLAFDRLAMLSGGPASYVSFLVLSDSAAEAAWVGVVPTDLGGSTPPPGPPNWFARLRANGQKVVSGLEILGFSVDFQDTESSRFASVARLISAGLTHLDAEGSLTRLSYRNQGTHEALVTTHIVNIGGLNSQRGIRWYELRRPPGGAWSIFQQGTYSPDAADRWGGSIAMDRQGNILLSYGTSNGSMPSSIRYTGRLATDLLDTLPRAEVALGVRPGSPHRKKVAPGGRTSVRVDPADQCTFWLTGEYGDFSVPDVRKTLIAALRAPDCDTTP